MPTLHLSHTRIHRAKSLTSSTSIGPVATWSLASGFNELGGRVVVNMCDYSTHTLLLVWSLKCLRNRTTYLRLQLTICQCPGVAGVSLCMRLMVESLLAWTIDPIVFFLPLPLFFFTTLISMCIYRQNVTFIKEKTVVIPKLNTFSER